MNKYLDVTGLTYLWSKLSLEDYPNNETLIAVLNAIDETKADKTYVQHQVALAFVNASSEPATHDIPKVFINGIVPTTKDEVLAELTYISKTLSFHSYITIKCQGTSSMKYPVSF